MNSWELASSASKLLVLLAMAGVIGGSVGLFLAGRQRMPQDRAILRYIAASAVLGFLGAALFFLIQIGAVNQQGLAGMLDGLMISILIQSDLGVSLGLRLFGFSCAAIASLWVSGRTRNIVLVSAVAILAFAFSVTGHISTLADLAKAGIVLHVLAASMWVGALYPLLHLSRANESLDVKRLMRFFGEIAVYVVGVLLLSGTFLLTQTLGSFGALFTTDYGLAVLAKLSVVLVLLGLAATNKLMLVPRLHTAIAARRLQLSIKSEMLMGLLILAVTAWLTTAVDTAH